MECVEYSHRGRKVQLISAGSYSCQDFEWFNLLVIKLFAWSGGADIPW